MAPVATVGRVRFYPFNIGDYAAATRHLSLLEDLAYRRILDAVYLDEEFPAGTPEEVARKIGMREHAEAVRNVLGEFFTRSEDGRWMNSRCEEEINRYQSQVNGGRRGAAARWKNGGGNALPNTPPNGGAIDPPMPTKNQDQEPRTKTKKQKKPTEGVPEGVSPKVWQDFLVMRRAKHAPVTETVLNRIVAEAAKVGWTLEQAVTEMVARNWQGFRSDWVIRDRGNNKHDLSNINYGAQEQDI